MRFDLFPMRKGIDNAKRPRIIDDPIPLTLKVRSLFAKRPERLQIFCCNSFWLKQRYDGLKQFCGAVYPARDARSAKGIDPGQLPNCHLHLALELGPESSHLTDSRKVSLYRLLQLRSRIIAVHRSSLTSSHFIDNSAGITAQRIKPVLAPPRVLRPRHRSPGPGIRFEARVRL